MVSSHVECALGISGCEQQCYYCTCRNGFSLQNDSKSCCTFTCAIDIDECINETLACPSDNDIRINTHGSYVNVIKECYQWIM